MRRCARAETSLSYERMPRDERGGKVAGNLRSRFPLDLRRWFPARFLLLDDFELVEQSRSYTLANN